MLRSGLLGQERPKVAELLRSLRLQCENAGLHPPSRAQVYRVMARCDDRSLVPNTLSTPVQTVLYNLDLSAPVSGRQLAFALFHYGDLRALSFAAGLPWLSLYQAARLPGWRPRTRGLLDAVLRARGIA